VQAESGASIPGAATDAVIDLTKAGQQSQTSLEVPRDRLDAELEDGDIDRQEYERETADEVDALPISHEVEMKDHVKVRFFPFFVSSLQAHRSCPHTVLFFCPRYLSTPTLHSTPFSSFSSIFRRFLPFRPPPHRPSPPSPSTPPAPVSPPAHTTTTSNCGTSAV